MLAEFNDLKFRQQEQRRDEATITGNVEDPVVLKLKLM